MAAGLRAELDERQEKIGYKIREAQLQKVPYMLVVGRPGGRRGHGGGAHARRRRPGGAAVDEFIAAALEEVARARETRRQPGTPSLAHN